MNSKEIKVSRRLCMEIENCFKEALDKYEKFSSIVSPVIGILIGENFTQWSLAVQPYCSGEENKKNFGFYLRNQSSDSIKFNTNYTLGILSTTGNNYSIAEDKTTGKEYAESGKNRGFGSRQFISYDELLINRKDLIVDGKITFFCNLTISALEENTKVQEKVPMNKILEDYKKMFDDELLSDFEIKTKDGEKLKAHKAILAARSPMFYAMLTNDMKEAKENFVVVPDFDSVVMKEVLRFIYYNEIKNLNNLARDLICAAEKYQLVELKEICISPIILTLSVDNAVESLLIADRISNTKNLFEESLKLIMSNFDVISNTAEWKDLSSNITTKIIKTMSISYSQDNIVFPPKSF